MSLNKEPTIILLPSSGKPCPGQFYQIHEAVFDHMREQLASGPKGFYIGHSAENVSMAERRGRSRLLSQDHRHGGK